MAPEVTGGRYFASDFSKFDKFLSFEVFRTGKSIPRSTRIDLARAIESSVIFYRDIWLEQDWGQIYSTDLLNINNYLVLVGSALEYLHSHFPPLAYRDIKPVNILVQFRMPFVIKLADFELIKNDFFLKTFYESNEYAAPEI